MESQLLISDPRSHFRTLLATPTGWQIDRQAKKLLGILNTELWCFACKVYIFPHLMRDYYRVGFYGEPQKALIFCFVFIVFGSTFIWGQTCCRRIVSNPVINSFYYFSYFSWVVHWDGRCVLNSKHLSLFFIGCIVPDSSWRILEVAQVFSLFLFSSWLFYLQYGASKWGTPRKMRKDSKFHSVMRKKLSKNCSLISLKFFQIDIFVGRDFFFSFSSSIDKEAKNYRLH